MNAYFVSDINMTLYEFKDMPIRRIYYGSEFCELAISTKQDIIKVVEYCQSKKLSLTLVFPPVSENNFSKCVELIDLFVFLNSITSSEITCNDLGLLFYISQNHPNVTCLHGRVFQKCLNDPRISSTRILANTSTDGRRVLLSSSISSNEVDILKALNICRIEVDSSYNEILNNDFNYTIYMPFCYYSTGHICLFRNLGLSEGKKFSMSTSGCLYKCKNYFQTLSNKFNISNSLVRDELMLFRAGNTIFFKNDFIAKRDILKNFRVVLQPYPMI